MRTTLTTGLGYGVIPFLAAIAIAYIWVVSALLGREQHPKAAERRISRAA